MKHIVILISGSGSNMAAIADAARQRQWQARLGARIAQVISNRPDAPGLALAQARGLGTEVVDHRAHAEASDPRASFDAALMSAIDRHAPALVVLAGFMRILTPGFVQHYQGRLLNIHPSLLPAFTGLHTHRRAIEAGCRFAGATVHEVTEQLDHGRILSQAVVPVLPSDTPESLGERVLAQEHLIYPQAIEQWLIARG